MTTFSPRVPHLFPPRTLARLLTPTYAQAADVDVDEAHERLTLAFASAALVADLQRGISAALEEAQGPRTSSDKLLDRLSARLGQGGRVRAAASSAGLAAVLVRIHLELGLAPEQMRATLATPRGAAALDDGLRALGAHVVKELLR